MKQFFVSSIIKMGKQFVRNQYILVQGNIIFKQAMYYDDIFAHEFNVCSNGHQSNLFTIVQNNLQAKYFWNFMGEAMCTVSVAQLIDFTIKLRIKSRYFDLL